MKKYLQLILAVTIECVLLISCAPNIPNLKGRIVFALYNYNNSDIYLMDANGQNVKQLTTNPAEDDSPAWSPDNSQIVFISNRDGNPEIYKMNNDGSNQTRLTNSPDIYETRPSWAPDGKRIVFSALPGYLAILNLETKSIHPITDSTDRIYETDPSWSPDGHQIVFATKGLQNYSLDLIDPDGNNRISLLEAPWPDPLLNPSWSPDGSQIIYQRLSSSKHPGGTWVVSSDGSHEKHLSEKCDGTSLSADGQWLVCRLFGNNNSSEIDIIRISDGTQYRLTNTPYMENGPVWSH